MDVKLNEMNVCAVSKTLIGLNLDSIMNTNLMFHLDICLHLPDFTAETCLITIKLTMAISHLLCRNPSCGVQFLKGCLVQPKGGSWSHLQVPQHCAYFCQKDQPTMTAHCCLTKKEKE